MKVPLYFSRDSFGALGYRQGDLIRMEPLASQMLQRSLAESLSPDEDIFVDFRFTISVSIGDNRANHSSRRSDYPLGPKVAVPPK